MNTAINRDRDFQQTSTDHMIDVMTRLRDQLMLSERAGLPMASHALYDADAILKTYGR